MVGGYNDFDNDMAVCVGVFVFVCNCVCTGYVVSVVFLTMIGMLHGIYAHMLTSHNNRAPLKCV